MKAIASFLWLLFLISAGVFAVKVFAAIYATPSDIYQQIAAVFTRAVAGL